MKTTTTTTRPLSLLAACLVSASVSEAQLVEDQQQTSTTSLMAYISTAGQAQSFRQTNGNIAGASILLWNGAGSPSTILISLWDALPNQGGTQLTAGLTSGVPGQWADVFWTPYAVNPGQTYCLVFSGSDSSNAIAGDLNDPYPGGQVYAAGYNGFPLYDFTFKTWFDPCVVPSSETTRLGTPPNPNAFLPGVTSGPVIGATWDPIIDHAAFFPTAVVDFAAVSVRGPINLPLAIGTLLCQVPPSPQIFIGPPGVAFSIAVPLDCSLVGLAACSQGGSFAPGAIQLTNALDLVVGGV